MCGCCSSKKNKNMDLGSHPSQDRSSNFPATNNSIVPEPPQPGEGPARVASVITTGNAPNSSLLNITSNFDWDALYEDNTEPASSSEETKQSVLSFLWSQLRIGMDLTKIALPTYILERRSLLEMYADFFAHPDMFVAIADAPTAKERMIAVTKWYVASFYAGRKSDVAKKPYNPILGEVFSCWWNSVGLNSRLSQTPDPSTIPPEPESKPNQIPKFSKNVITDSNRAFFSSDGSFLPWSYDSKNTLIFFGEQVSHHPPISAFYAEHVDKRICVNAHIWTKSKFLGLSVAVHNVGDATVCVQTGSGAKEEYVLGFPSGYARSILSVPWIELGGQVDITCAQTGFKGVVEFCTKTMLGRDRNRVIAKLYSPGDKKPYVVMDGLWNDTLSLKVPENKERYLDVKGLRNWKKETRHVTEQEVFESRRLWKDVTKALKYNDVDGASKAKMAVEERQRLEAKDREEGKFGWRPRMFEKSGDKWNFVQSLDKR